MKPFLVPDDLERHRSANLVIKALCVCVCGWWKMAMVLQSGDSHVRTLTTCPNDPLPITSLIS